MPDDCGRIRDVDISPLDDMNHLGAHPQILRCQCTSALYTEPEDDPMFYRRTLTLVSGGEINMTHLVHRQCELQPPSTLEQKPQISLFGEFIEILPRGGRSSCRSRSLILAYAQCGRVAHF